MLDNLEKCDRDKYPNLLYLIATDKEKRFDNIYNIDTGGLYYKTLWICNLQ